MTEVKATYKLYALSDRLTELEQTIELLEGVDIPADLHLDYLKMLEELDQTKKDFLSKVDGIVSLIQSRKRWLQVRKEECVRLQKLVKRDEKTVDWLSLYLQEHLNKQGIKKLRTNKFNLSIIQASVAPLILDQKDPNKIPSKYQKVTVEIDKKLRSEDLKNGVDVSNFAHLGEKSTYLSIK